MIEPGIRAGRGQPEGRLGGDVDDPGRRHRSAGGTAGEPPPPEGPAPPTRAIGPMETWSSWLALVGTESTDAGCARTLFSDARAAAVYWTIISPESSPLAGARKAGRPPLRRGSRSSDVRRSLIAPSSAIAILAKSSASATDPPCQLPP